MSGVLSLVSAGLMAPKKADHLFARKHRYLNYGLVTLGTLLDQAGYNVRVFHGGFEVPEEFAVRLFNGGAVSADRPVLLSLPSFLAVEWASRFLRQLRVLLPSVKVVVGGRWVVGDDSAWIRRKLPEADLVVYGIAESRIVDLLDISRWKTIPATDCSQLPGVPPPWVKYIDLQHSLVDSFEEFTPSVEVSRGCGRGCSFCEERAAPLTKLRDPASVRAAMERAHQEYRDYELHFYLEASWFVPTLSWASAFRQQYVDASLKGKWRCETRVDSLKPATLTELAAAGLKVIDLGLESASCSQLKRMQKTNDPIKYLRDAAELLRWCQDLGVWAKVNVMLYAGETQDTLDESLDWLEKHRVGIKGVSVGPVMLYGHGAKAQHDFARLARYGAAIVDKEAPDRDGFAALHLSSSMDAESAADKAAAISRSFMTDRDYYDLKGFSYFPRGYSYEDFRLDLSGADAQSLPFSASAGA